MCDNMPKENEIKIAVRSLVVLKDKHLCLGCQKPNKTRYMIIDKDKNQASAYALAQKFYGLPFATVDQNRQTYMCRVCYRLIKKYYNYTEKAKEIRESLQKTSANLETIVIIKHKNTSTCNIGSSKSTVEDLEPHTDLEDVTLETNVDDNDSPSETDHNAISSTASPRRSSRLTERLVSHSPNKVSENRLSRKRPHENSPTVNSTLKYKIKNAKDGRDLVVDNDDKKLEDQTKSTESDSDKEGTEEPVVRYRVVEQLEEATYTKEDVMRSLEKLDSPNVRSGHRGVVQYVSHPGKKRVREVKYRSLAIAEMYEDAIKSLADGSVRKAIKLVARVTDKTKRRDFLDAIEDLVNIECRILEKKENSEALRYSSVDEIKFSNMLKEVRRHCPILWSCVVAAANGPVAKPDLCDNKILAAVAILLQNRNGNINAFQTFISIMAKEYHIKKEGLNILNQFGITLSSKTTYSRLHQSGDATVKAEADDEEEEDHIVLKEEDEDSEILDEDDLEKTVVDHTYCTQEESEITEQIEEIPPDVGATSTIAVVELATYDSTSVVTANGHEPGESTTEVAQTEVIELSESKKEDILKTSMISLTDDQTIDELIQPSSPVYIETSQTDMLLIQ